MNILLFLFKFTAIGLCTSSKTSKTVQLLNAVQTNISAYIKPGLDTDEPVVVNVTFNLMALTELNEVKGYISTIGCFEVTWIDDRIPWATEDYEGISWISVDARKVWIPKVIVTNPSDKLYTLHDIPTEVGYSSNGLAYWRPGGVTKTICYIRIHRIHLTCIHVI